jgi:hypothetical protein
MPYPIDLALTEDRSDNDTSVAFSFFGSADFVFGKTYKFSQGSTHLMFFSVCVGLLLCALSTPLFGLVLRWEHKRAAAQGKNAGPEVMLWWALIGGPLLPVSCFWLAWSARDSVSYWLPMIA